MESNTVPCICFMQEAMPQNLFEILVLTLAPSQQIGSKHEEVRV